MNKEKSGINYYKILLAVLIIACTLMFIYKLRSVGSGSSGDGLSITGFAFNTTYTITINEGGDKELLDSCVSKCNEYENIFSRTREGSELYCINEILASYAVADREGAKKNNAEYSINKDGSIEFKISETMYKILEKGIYYSKLSDGSFDITIEPVSSLWDFTSEQPKVPDAAAIKEALPYVGYEDISLHVYGDVYVLKVDKPGMGIDLGGIAKGFIADGLKEYLVEGGVTSGMINLGGNVLCIGKKSDGSNYNIGIQKPFADRNETVTAVSVNDASVVSSGIYERYFEQNGTLYHHILNPATGYPYENALMGVTILSDKSVDGDGLSTTCFALGLEKGLELINSMDGVEALFITKDEKMHYSQGFQ